MTKIYKYPIAKVWDESSRNKRAELARTLGYRSEWSKINFMELHKRGGGMLQRDLFRLWKLYEIRKKK